jgi:hypothetical protein
VATYKVIQNIEAEDKILGPLTLRQFIFALIAAFLFYLCFLMVIKHLIFLLVIFLPPALFFGFFALPFGRDQPTEVWALAKLRFWFKPRRRIWNQSGVKELVTITVPKKIEHVYTNGLSQGEVQSRLQVLAQTIDSRGWATKHVNVGTYTPQAAMVAGDGSDRLLDITSMPQEVPTEEAVTPNDILDVDNNPIARQFTTMIDESSRAHRQALIEQMNAAAAPVPVAAATTDNHWFMTRHSRSTNTPGVSATPVPAAAVDSTSEAVLAASLSARAGSRQAFGNLRTVQPLAARKPAPVSVAGDDVITSAVTALPDDQTASAQQAEDTMTAPRDPAILSLAKNNDLNLATLARQAKKNRAGGQVSPNEVVVALH